MPMAFRFATIHMKLRSGDAASLGALDSESTCGIEAVQRAGQSRRIGARIDQRANSHVSTNPRKRIKITNFHDNVAQVSDLRWFTSPGKTSPEAPIRNSSTKPETAVAAKLILITIAPADFATRTSPAAGYTTADV